MRLHENIQQMAEAIRITAHELQIPEQFVEKDYWICQILQRLSRIPQMERTVWKGGTSLTKGYGVLQRFSSDVDLAIISEGLTNNQQKNLVLHIGKDTTVDLIESEEVGCPIKNSRFRKTYHLYPSVVKEGKEDLSFLGNFVIVEINTYGNPYPFVKLPVKSFISEMMERRGLASLIEEMDMSPFYLNVLDIRRTLCEKVVSLLRFSFEEDPISGLASKIRHFYDLHFLFQDEKCRAYLEKDFTQELRDLIAHDKREFDRPPLWRNSPIETSVLLTDFDRVWQRVSPIYRQEVGALAYGQIPDNTEIANSMHHLLEIVRKSIV